MTPADPFFVDAFGPLSAALPSSLHFARLADRRWIDWAPVSQSLINALLSQPAQPLCEVLPFASVLASVDESGGCFGNLDDAMLRDWLEATGFRRWSDVLPLPVERLREKPGTSDALIESLLSALIGEYVESLSPIAPTTSGSAVSQDATPSASAAAPSSSAHEPSSPDWPAESAESRDANVDEPAAMSESGEDESATEFDTASVTVPAADDGEGVTVARLFPAIGGRLPLDVAQAHPASMSPEMQAGVIDLLVRRCSEMRTLEFGRLTPAIRAFDRDEIEWTDLPAVGAAPISARATVILRTCGIVTWRDLRRVTPLQLGLVRNGGEQTVREVIRAAVSLGLSAHSCPSLDLERLGEDTAPQGDRDAEVAGDLPDDFVRSLRTLAEWTLSESSGETFADLWRKTANRDHVPPHISEAREILGSTLLADLLEDSEEMDDGANEAPLQGAESIELLRDLLATLSHKHRLAIRESFAETPSMSRSSLAVALQVSLEGIDDALDDAKDALIELADSDDFDELHDRLENLVERVGSWAPLDDPTMRDELDALVPPGEQDAEMLRGVARILAGYSDTDGAYETEELEGIGRTLEAKLDGNFVMSRADAESGISKHGVHSRHFNAFLAWLNGFSAIGDMVAAETDDFVDNAVAVLAANRRSMTPAELLYRTNDGVQPEDLELELDQDPRVRRIDDERFTIVD